MRMISWVRAATEQGWVCERDWHVQDRFPVGKDR